jgi:hypothetical protein
VDLRRLFREQDSVRIITPDRCGRNFRRQQVLNHGRPRSADLVPSHARRVARDGLPRACRRFIMDCRAASGSRTA